MAAAVSSMENGMSSSSRSTPQQRQQQQQQQQQQPQPRPQHQRRHTAGATGSRQAAGGRPIRPRLSSSSRSSSSASSSSRLSSRTSSRAPSPFRSSSSLIPSAARIGGSGPSSSFSSSSSSSISARGSRGAASGLWASIMWLGAAALPASLSPPSSSGAAAVGASPSGHGRSGSGVDGGGGTRGGMAAVRTRNLSSSSSSSSSSSLSQPPSSLPETAASPARIAAEHPGLAMAAGGGRDGEAGSEAAPVRLPLLPPLSIGARGMVVRAEPVGGSGTAVGARGAEEEAATAAMAPVSGSGVGRAGSPKKHVYLEGSTAVYTCSMCRVHLATRDHVVSECFHGHGGRAFLFERCVNVSAGRPEDRLLMTGMHVVADISCKRCGAELGWKYEEAAEKSQKYKEGKFILERCAVALEGRSGDAYRDLSSSHANTRYGGAERCGSRSSSSSSSSSVIGWGADRSDSSARW